MELTSFQRKADNYIKAHISNGKFNGNLLIMKGDSVLYSRCYGWANRQFKISNTDSTRFLIGSITKTFTALAILLLEKEGLLQLTDSLSTYFPHFPRSEEVNIQQLLTHRSGIKDYHEFPDWREKGRLIQSPFETLNDVSRDPFLFNPGEHFSYSNTGYILLGLIIEQVSGLSFEDYIQQAILNPLNLKNTGIITNDKWVANLASGYSTNPREIHIADYIHYNQPFSSGNMYSSTKDLFYFCKAVMEASLLDSVKTREIFEVSETYGYGWGIRNYTNTLAYGHHGAMNGFSGSMTYIPEGKYFICFLTNDDHTPKYSLANDLASLVLGEEIQNPPSTSLIELTDKMKVIAIGDYLIKSGDTLHINEKAGRLYMKETGQEEHELFPYSERNYSMSLLEFQLYFSNLKEGKAQSLQFIGKAEMTADRVQL